jgi:hypothetical protein
MLRMQRKSQTDGGRLKDDMIDSKQQLARNSRRCSSQPSAQPNIAMWRSCCAAAPSHSHGIRYLRLSKFVQTAATTEIDRTGFNDGLTTCTFFDSIQLEKALSPSSKIDLAGPIFEEQSLAKHRLQEESFLQQGLPAPCRHEQSIPSMLAYPRATMPALPM